MPPFSGQGVNMALVDACCRRTARPHCCPTSPPEEHPEERYAVRTCIGSRLTATIVHGSRSATGSSGATSMSR